tara:strand:- start:193 stop:474 length:282 start_codon:yes stop_codon:yes gene_type:complete
MENFEIKAGLINYDVNFIVYDANGFITTDCNSILLINYGTNAVQIESVVLQQNQSLNIEGNQGEFLQTRLLATFINTGGSNNLVSVKKNYVNA